MVSAVFIQKINLGFRVKGFCLPAYLPASSLPSYLLATFPHINLLATTWTRLQQPTYGEHVVAPSLHSAAATVQFCSLFSSQSSSLSRNALLQQRAWPLPLPRGRGLHCSAATRLCVRHVRSDDTCQLPLLSPLLLHVYCIT